MNQQDPWAMFADAEPEQSATPEPEQSQDPWAAFADAPQQEQAPPQESGAYNTALAPLRGFNKGLADMVSAPYRAIDWVQEQTVGRLTGEDYMPDVEDMDMWKYYREPEKAKTTTGHYLQSAGEAVGSSAVPAMGLAAAAPKIAAMTANTLPRAVGQAFGESVAKAPATAAMADVASTATSGAAQQYAADEGYGLGVQTMAGLAGGIAPFAADGAARTIAKAPQAMKTLRSTEPNAARAQQMAQDMRDLDIEPFGPAVATARRNDNSAGRVAQALMDKPFVGKPLYESRQRFLDDMARVAHGVRDDYGKAMGHAELGSNINKSIDHFKTGTYINAAEMSDDELIRLAQSDVREVTLPDVQAARYELADRSLPAGKLRGGTREDEEALKGALPRTREVLRQIKERYGKTINKAEAVRDAEGLDPSLTLMGGFEHPRWTGHRVVDKSMDAIISSKGNWRTGVQGIREVRSNLRRAEAAMTDTQPNALTHGDIKRLHGTVSEDTREMFINAGERAQALGRTDEARAYHDAASSYEYADDLTRVSKEHLQHVNNGITNMRKDESVASGVINAMKRGKTGNINALRGLSKVLPESGLDEIASTVIAEIGRPKGAAGSALKEAEFSPSLFAKNWYELSDEAKRIFFSRRPRQRMMLDKLARVAQASKDYEMLANTSKTGVSNFVTAAMGTGGLAMIDWRAAAVGIAGFMIGRGVAHYMSSPAYVSWLSRSLDLPPVKFTRALKQLRGIALKDKKIGPKERQTLLTLIRQVEGGIDKEAWQKRPGGAQIGQARQGEIEWTP